MESQTSSRPQHPAIRQLASLKVLSRLLGHELHSQASTKSITLSREEVIEIQTTVDLFIEELGRRMSQVQVSPGTLNPVESPAIGARN